MKTQIEIKRLIKQLDKKAEEHKRKIEIIQRIKFLIDTASSRNESMSSKLNES